MRRVASGKSHERVQTTLPGVVFKAPRSVIVAVLILMLFFNPLMQQAAQQFPAAPLLRQTIVIGPNSYSEINFEIAVGAEGVVNGTVSATGGAGNDVRVWVLTEAQRKAWRPSVPAPALFDSNRQHEIRLDLDLPDSGQYHLVIDNSFSVVSSKQVTADVRLIANAKGSMIRPCSTVLVLSIGDLKGLAHIGAIDALAENGVLVDCVFGNSMGSLIGSLYAVSPSGNLRTRFRELMAGYVRLSREQAGTQAGLFALGAAVLSGGALSILGAAATGGLMVQKIDLDRFRTAMNNYYAGARIERTKLPYATSYQVKSESGLDLKIASSGNLAEATSRSINNPYIFQNTSLDYLDPGSDRMAAVPVEDACAHFKAQNIIAINVTGNPIVVSKQMNCQYIEVVVNSRKDIPRDAMLGVGDEFEQLYRLGYETTRKRLESVADDAFPLIPVTWHPSDTIVRDPSGGFWIIEDGRKRRTSAHDWIPTNTIEANEKELGCFTTATVPYIEPQLVKAPHVPTIYLVTPDGYKHAVFSADVFAGLDYKWENVRTVSSLELARYPDHPISPVLYSPIPGGTLVRAFNSSTVFVISDGKRRAIPSGRIFKALGYQWDAVKEVPASLLQTIPESDPIGGTQIGQCLSQTR